MRTLLLFALSGLLFSCTEVNNETSEVTTTIVNPTNKVTLISEIDWQMLNPARGENSPKAGTVWGDRNGTEPTGFLAEFKDGFSSPPHIHNVTYRAMVISGEIHNDDPNAEKMWMPAGSFWTQPAGESHITAAKGSKNIAYVEIDKGPYLVKPIDEAFDKGERPLNIDKSNIVWLDASKTTYIQKSQNQNTSNQPALAFLWKQNDLKGHLVKLPAGFKGKIESNGSAFHAVVIQGKPNYLLPNEDNPKTLDPGSYFTSTEKAVHDISSSATDESIIYIRTNNEFKVIAK